MGSERMDLGETNPSRYPIRLRNRKLAISNERGMLQDALLVYMELMVAQKMKAAFAASWVSIRHILSVM